MTCMIAKALFCTPRAGRKPKPLQRTGPNAVFEFNVIKQAFVPAFSGIRRRYIKRKKLLVRYFPHLPVTCYPNDKGNYTFKRAEALPVEPLQPQERFRRLAQLHEDYRRDRKGQ